jgi:predicted porin
LENFEMKKTLVAVAALAAVFGAQAQATISGVIEAGILIPNTGTQSMASGGNGGSEITFTAGEDLGSGLKATGSVTIVNNMFAASDSGAPAAGTTAAVVAKNAVRTYNSFVGLSGDFGSVKLGSQFSPSFFATGVGDPFGNAAGTYNRASQGGHRYDSVTYNSPSMAGATVSYQVNAANTESSYSVTYATGGFTAAYSADTTASTDTSGIAASYDFGVAKAYYLSKTTEGSTAANSLGVSAPVAGFVVVYSRSQQSGQTDQANIGLVYPMSKRTTLAWVNYDGGTTATQGNFVGVQHKF